METENKAGQQGGTPHVSEEKWAELEAKYRAKHADYCAEYRAKFGEEPSLGTLMTHEGRQKFDFNNRTREQRRAGALRAMARIYGAAAAEATAAISHESATVRR